jgi:hypothetical protein
LYRAASATIFLKEIEQPGELDAILADFNEIVEICLRDTTLMGRPGWRGHADETGRA